MNTGWGSDDWEALEFSAWAWEEPPGSDEHRGTAILSWRGSYSSEQLHTFEAEWDCRAAVSLWDGGGGFLCDAVPPGSTGRSARRR